MIIDIKGEHGIVVSSPTKKSPIFKVCFESDGFIVWEADKERAIRSMTNFVNEAQKALETLYGFPGGDGDSTPPLKVVEPVPAPQVPAGQMTLADAA